MNVSDYTKITAENVVCLHSSLSSSRQWEGLQQRLSHIYRVSAIDLLGYGDAPGWPHTTTRSLDYEVDALAELLEQLQGPVHLVGHSYGGAVAIKAAQTLGTRIRSLTLYEPVIFAALITHSPHQPASVEIQQLMRDIRNSVYDGDTQGATRRFIDYWSGDGSWEALTRDRQQRLAAKIGVLLINFDALTSETNALADLARIKLPTLYLSGRESPAAINAVSNLFRLKLPWALNYEFAGMGHMGPITHSEIVNEEIAGFIQRLSGIAYSKAIAQAA